MRAFLFALALLLVPGTAAAQDEPNASTIARSLIGVDATMLIEAEALDCEGLRDKARISEWLLVSIVRPEILLPSARQDWSAAGDDLEALEPFMRAQQAFYTVVALEKGCFAANIE